jgi:glycosyltransferase involved in cell wall biosynthesis
MKHIAVVVPAKDEEATIGELLDRIDGVRVSGCELRPIVVDDGSTDRTAEIARERGADVVPHAQNRGVGAAVRTGLRTAVERGADAVAYLDADLEYYPEDIPRLVEPVLAGRANYVLGSRFLDGVRGMKFYRRIGNHAFTLLLVLLTRSRMTHGQTGMRAFSREAAAMAEIIHDYNYAQVLTLDLLRKGCTFEEVPVRYRLREHGKSFISWRYPARVLPAIWRESRAPERLTPLSTSQPLSLRTSPAASRKEYRRPPADLRPQPLDRRLCPFPTSPPRHLAQAARQRPT